MKYFAISTSEEFMRNFLVRVFAISILTIWPISGKAQLHKQAEALALIRETAKDLCELPLKGALSHKQLSVEAKAKVAGLVKKAVDLGVEGSSKYATKESQAALVDRDVLPALKEGFACRLHIFDKLSEKFLTQPSSTTSSPHTDQRSAMPLASAYLDRPGLFVGISRTNFLRQLDDVNIQWKSTSNGLLAEYETSYMGQKAKALFYFTSDVNTHVHIAQQYNFTYGTLFRDIERPQSYKNEYSRSQVKEICEKVMSMPSAALAKFGQALGPELKERIDYRGWADRESACQDPNVQCREDGVANNVGDRSTLKFRISNKVKANLVVETFMRGYERRPSTSVYETKYWDGCYFEWHFFPG